MSDVKLSTAQEKCILHLYQNGGVDSSGIVDRYGRVVAGGKIHPQGSYTSWMTLVTLGLVEGRDGRIRLSKKGEHVGLVISERNLRG